MIDLTVNNHMVYVLCYQHLNVNVKIYKCIYILFEKSYDLICTHDVLIHLQM